MASPHLEGSSKGFEELALTPWKEKCGFTCKAHTSILRSPADTRYNEKKPPSERAIICRRSNCREYKCHNLVEPCVSPASIRPKKAHTAKLSPLAISTMLETAFVPPAHGKTHCPEESGARQDEPGPLRGSYPASVARDWKRVMENPIGPTP